MMTVIIKKNNYFRYKHVSAQLIEQSGILVASYTRAQEALCLNLGKTPTILTENFRGLSQSIQANNKRIQLLNYDCFLRTLLHVGPLLGNR